MTFILLSERNQYEKSTQFITVSIWHSEKGTTVEKVKRIARGWGAGRVNR